MRLINIPTGRFFRIGLMCIFDRIYFLCFFFSIFEPSLIFDSYIWTKLSIKMIAVACVVVTVTHQARHAKKCCLRLETNSKLRIAQIRYLSAFAKFLAHHNEYEKQMKKKKMIEINRCAWYTSTSRSTTVKLIAKVWCVIECYLLNKNEYWEKNWTFKMPAKWIKCRVWRVELSHQILH